MSTFFHADATITDGTINNTSIGNIIPSTAAFTNATVNTQFLTDFIDGLTASPLNIGSATSTKVQIGKNAGQTQIEGYLDVVNYITANSLDARAVTTLSIGTVSANDVEISHNGALTQIQSALNILNSIDTTAGVQLAVGPAAATSVAIGSSNADTYILGKTLVKQGVAGVNVGIDVASSGTLAIGGSTATGIQTGSTAVDTSILGGLLVRAGAAGVHIGLDVASAGILAIGGATSTLLTIAKSGIATRVLGEIDIQGVMDTIAAGALQLGPATATSVAIGAATVNTTILGKTIVKQGSAGANVGVDVAAAGIMALGGQTATGLELGGATVNTKILGQLTAKQGAASANVGVDVAAAGTLALGGSIATLVTLGLTTADSSILGGLLVRNGTAAPNKGIDVAAAGILALGGLTATAIEIGKVGATSRVKGNLSVDQNALINGNLTVNGTMTTINTQNLNIADSCITLNEGYIAEPAHSGCITVVTDPAPGAAQTTVTTGGFTAAVAATSGPRVAALANVFTAGQIVTITGAANDANTGLYQFVSASGTGPFVLTFASTVGGTAPTTGVDFVQDNFVTDATAIGTLTLTAVSVMHVSGAGVWGTATGSSGANFAAYRSIVGGPASSTIAAIARYNSITGDLIQDSVVTIADTTGVININNTGGNLQITGVNVFPVVSIDKTLPRFNGTTGRALQSSSIVVDDLNNMSGVVDLIATGASTLGGVTKTVVLSALGAVAIAGKDILTNATYNADPPVTGGLVTVYDPTTIQNAVAAGGFASSNTVVTSNAFTFTAGDIIQVVSAANQNNNGIYEVASYLTGTITINTTPSASFSKNVFVVNTTVAGTITKVNVSHIRSGIDGTWGVAKGSVTPLVYSDLSVGLTGLGATNRLTYWSSATSLTNAQIVVDSNNNINMGNAVPASGGRHIVKSYEAYSISSAGAASPSVNLDTSFVTVSDATTCTGTLASGTFIGQDHAIVASSIFAAGLYNLTVTNYQPSAGAAGSKVLQFSSSGQSAHLVWDGAKWMCINAGVSIL